MCVCVYVCFLFMCNYIQDVPWLSWDDCDPQTTDRGQEANAFLDAFTRKVFCPCISRSCVSVCFFVVTQLNLDFPRSYQGVVLFPNAETHFVARRKATSVNRAHMFERSFNRAGRDTYFEIRDSSF